MSLAIVYLNSEYITQFAQLDLEKIQVLSNISVLLFSILIASLAHLNLLVLFLVQPLEICKKKERRENDYAFSYLKSIYRNNKETNQCFHTLHLKQMIQI
jgi:hypothetical protein